MNNYQDIKTCEQCHEDSGDNKCPSCFEPTCSQCCSYGERWDVCSTCADNDEIRNQSKCGAKTMRFVFLCASCMSNYVRREDTTLESICACGACNSPVDRYSVASLLVEIAHYEKVASNRSTKIDELIITNRKQQEHT